MEEEENCSNKKLNSSILAGIILMIRFDSVRRCSSCMATVENLNKLVEIVMLP